jgi:hypothetical protein
MHHTGFGVDAGDDDEVVLLGAVAGFVPDGPVVEPDDRPGWLTLGMFPAVAVISCSVGSRPLIWPTTSATAISPQS